MRVKEWNFNTRVNYYPGECGIVKGTNVTRPTSTFGLGIKAVPIFYKKK